MFFLRRLVALAAAFVLSSAAQAIPIAYEFSGTVSSGSPNGVSFADRGFAVNVFGDTSGVTNAGGLFMDAASAVTFSIAGVGGGSLTPELEHDVSLVSSRHTSSGAVIVAADCAGFFGGNGPASYWAPGDIRSHS